MQILKFALFVSMMEMTVGTDWCYKSQVSCDNYCKGPDDWRDIASTCGSNSQSPVNIVTKKVVTKSLTPLRFEGYQHGFHSIITNNGHTVKVNLSGDAVIDGAGLVDKYKAVELHFHWGKNGGPGSEHTVDGEQYPMEMHIVHIKKIYNSIKEAINDSSGIAVLGFLYQESESENKNYDSIINALHNITLPERTKSKFKGNTSIIGPLSLDMLIPSHNTPMSYFRYNGSLTTPNCAESVIWTVFVNTINLSKKQMSTFSDLMFENGTAMTDTFRPVQPVNGRDIFYSGSSIAPVSTVLVISIIIMTFFNLY